jgi:serpin B
MRKYGITGGLFLIMLTIFLTSLVRCRPADTANLVGDNTEFALALYGRLASNEGNLFLAPYSMSSALAMTYAGARGNTAAQMADALRFTLKGDALHASFATATGALNARGKAGDFELSVANALWGQRGVDFLDEFLEINRKHYGAGLNAVDFAGDAEEARRTINTWVEKQTQDKIKDLIRPGILDTATELVLTNAIYFRGSWASRFDRAMTTEGQFWRTPEESMRVMMMRQSRKLGYMETDTFQALEVTYSGDELSMVVFLPREVDGLRDLERSLTATSLRTWLGQIRTEGINVSLPRFKMTAGFQLDEILQAMGMTDAFNSSLADFSGMTGNRRLFIDAVLHKATLDVNEEGSEAAAGTAVVMKKGPMPPVFNADHPFLFIIRDTASGSILFIGRLVDPAGESEGGKLQSD